MIKRERQRVSGFIKTFVEFSKLILRDLSEDIIDRRDQRILSDTDPDAVQFGSVQLVDDRSHSLLTAA